MDTSNRIKASAARVFQRRPDRLARRPGGGCAWRSRTGRLQRISRWMTWWNRLFGSGIALGGAEGSPWARTRGVLRLSPQRGIRSLYDEFATLRRCLGDAIEVLQGTGPERAKVSASIDEALDLRSRATSRWRIPSRPRRSHLLAGWWWSFMSGRSLRRPPPTDGAALVNYTRRADRNPNF